MSDGVEIAVTYYEPTGTPPAGGWPAVMMFHGLGQTRNSLDLNTWSANRVSETYLAPHGYAVLTFDARAHGESGGRFSLDGPRELADTRELFDWLVSKHPVDAAHVGAFGVSYGGGMVWLATVKGVPFRAIAVAATWTDLEETLAPENLVRSGIVVGLSRDVPQSRYDPALLTMLDDVLHGRNANAIRAFVAERSVRPQLSSITTPVFMIQGRNDFAFDANQAIAAYKAVRGPKRLYLGDLGHQPARNPVDEVPHFANEVVAWFDRYVKGSGTGIAPGRVELAEDPWNGKTVTYNGLPPTRALHFAVRRRGVLTATGRIVRTFGRVGHTETFGTPVVRVTVSSRSGYDHLVAALSAVTRSGKEILIADGGAATPSLGTKARTVAIRLQNEIIPVPKGSRLRVTIGATSTVQSSANIVYLTPVTPGQSVKISRISLTAPVLKKAVSP
jgi:predicted acyl esterase